MRAGTLNRKVTVQRQDASAVDAWGQPLPSVWLDVCTPWANIRHLSGAEAIKGDAITSTVRASIRIRYRVGIDAGMRVLHGATVYKVVAVMPDEARREHVDLVCEATK